MLLIHLLMNSSSVECTSQDFLLRLFSNYVYYHIIFPKIKKMRAEKKQEDWKIFQKLLRGEGNDYWVLESRHGTHPRLTVLQSQ